MPVINTPKRSFALVLALATAVAAAPQPASGEAGSLQFLSRPDGVLVGPVEEKDPDGVICPECGLLPEMLLDASPLPVAYQSQGGARITAGFGGLEDGRHTALESFTAPDDGDTQAQTRLFVVDTQPPVLELVRPAGGRLHPGEAVFWVRMADAGSGLPPTADMLRLEATLNGESLLWKLGSQAGERILILYGGHIPLPRGSAASLELTVWDRAGNPAVLTRDFRIELPQEKIASGQLVCDSEDGPHAYAVALSGDVPFGFRRLLHPLVVSPLTRDAELTIELPVIRGQTLAAEIAAAVILDGGHPAVRLQRQIGADGRTLRFRIEQTDSVSPAETLASMTLRIPKIIRFAFAYGCSDGHPFVAQAQMEALDWESLSLPLLLDWQWTTGIRVSQEGDRLVCRVEAGADGVVDPNSSWFAVDGRQDWFEPEHAGFFKATHGVAEGLVHFQVQLGSACGSWREEDPQAATDASGTLRRYAGDWLVRLGAPVIQALRYDPDLGVFLAAIEDEGTAPQDLVVRLQAGDKQMECQWEETSGMFYSQPMEPPSGIAPAVLNVTDRAAQTTVQTAFWGRPPLAEPLSPSVTAYHSTTHETSRLLYDTDVEAIADIRREDGLSHVKVCAREALPPAMPTPEEILRCERWVAQGGCLRLGCTASICRQPLGPTQYARQCSWVWRDITPPAIEMLECLPNGAISARIHDHGAPLAELQVNDSESVGVFDPVSGGFRTRAQITRGEHIRVSIHARDKAGNASSAFVELTVPLTPPDVRLEVRELEADGSRIIYEGLSLDALLTAAARDDSGLDHRFTRPSVDGHPVPVITTLDTTQDDTERIVFGAGGLAEGAHQAAITVADQVGLSAGAQVGFEILRAPQIRDFRFLNPPDSTVPATLFSARIADAGGDLSLAGITLHLDGQALPAARLFYHPESRYFAADGPQVLAIGAHEAVLAAVDERGHRTEQRLVFTWGAAGGAILAASGDLILEGVEIRELRPVDGDGLANPGEIVRLFLRLGHTGQEPLRDLTAELSALDPHLRVETPSLVLGELEAGVSAWRSPRGFDLHIASELASISRQDPYPLPLRLRIRDGSGRVWDFDFHLPVFRSRANPPGGIHLTLDPQARSTREVRILLRGSAQAVPEEDLEVTAQVNGTRYRADWSRTTGKYAVLADLALGDNPIEVEARTPDGRSQRIQALVERQAPSRPGSLSFITPGEGDRCDGCGEIPISGRFDSGGSPLEVPRVILTHLDGGGATRVIAITVSGDRFTGVIPADLPSGFYELRGTLRTASGETLSVLRHIEIASCT
jgi:hypothetical protein